MLIDWFTVVAQIVNFLILVALLKYFLYDRILKAMDEREEQIKSRIEEADKKKQEAQQEAESLKKKNQDFDNKREEMLAKAKEETEARRKQLAQQAHGEVEDLKTKWLTSIEKEKNSFIRDLRQMAAEQVYAVARRSLKDIADVDIEEQTIDVFLKRLRDLQEQKRNDLADSIKKGGNGVVVRSPFEIPSTSRQKITRALHDHIAGGIEVDYEIAPETILGIEMKTSDRKVVWSVEDYLASLEDAVRDRLERKTDAESAPGKRRTENENEENKE